MTHLPFILASYALGVLIPVGFGVAAFLRMTGARRRLDAIDPRVKDPRGGRRPRGAGGAPRIENPPTGSHHPREGVA
jgi:hypothetical protein